MYWILLENKHDFANLIDCLVNWLYWLIRSIFSRCRKFNWLLWWRLRSSTLRPYVLWQRPVSVRATLTIAMTFRWHFPLMYLQAGHHTARHKAPARHLTRLSCQRQNTLVEFYIFVITGKNIFGGSLDNLSSCFWFFTLKFWEVPGTYVILLKKECSFIGVDNVRY